MAVAGTFGWLAVALGAIVAQISERPRIALLLPFAWFAAFVLAALIAAAAVGPELCPR